MSDYLHAKTENVQKLLDNCLKKLKKQLIDDFLEKERNWLNLLNIWIEAYWDTPFKDCLQTLRDDIAKDFEKWQGRLEK